MLAEWPVHGVVAAVILAERLENTVTIRVAAVIPHTLERVYDMVALPGAMPVTTPVALCTVAIAVFELLHVPPAEVSVSVVLPPEQILVLPVIGAGAAGTVVTVIPKVVYAAPHVVVE
jgi:hypothetical protein